MPAWVLGIKMQNFIIQEIIYPSVDTLSIKEEGSSNLSEMELTLTFA